LISFGGKANFFAVIIIITSIFRMWPINGFIALRSLRACSSIWNILFNPARSASFAPAPLAYTSTFYAPARPRAAAAVVAVICLKGKPPEARADGRDPSIYPFPPYTLADVAQLFGSVRIVRTCRKVLNYIFFIWLFKERQIIDTHCVQ
jgi:hypothetical protein